MERAIISPITRGAHANVEGRRKLKRTLQILVHHAKGGTPSFAGDTQPVAKRQGYWINRLVDQLEGMGASLSDAQHTALDAFYPDKRKPVLAK